MNMLRPKQQGTSLGAGTASATLSTAGTAGTHLNSVEGVKAKVIHEVRRRRDLRWIDILKILDHIEYARRHLLFRQESPGCKTASPDRRRNSEGRSSGGTRPHAHDSIGNGPAGGGAKGC